MPLGRWGATLQSQRADRDWSADQTPFKALLQGAKMARDMRAGSGAGAGEAPAGTQPWFAPRGFACQDPGIPANTTLHLFGTDMWQEQLFHVLLATGAMGVLW